MLFTQGPVHRVVWMSCPQKWLDEYAYEAWERMTYGGASLTHGDPYWRWSYDIGRGLAYRNWFEHYLSRGREQGRIDR